ncbi:MAG: hypothetical protein IPM54_24335 [Polyangiaceae bacterium]|nr:hypothetical protein [Polyangiaceae bacterium]
MGTALNLADCYERDGRTASAYVAFGDAAAFARRVGDSDRADEAARRADALAPKLVKLAVTVPEPSRVQGLAVLRDGLPLAPTLWGTAIAVDPGEHIVEAKAPGRSSWKTTVKLDVPGVVQSVQVPVLDESRVPPPPGKPRNGWRESSWAALGLVRLAQRLVWRLPRDERTTSPNSIAYRMIRTSASTRKA